MEEINYTTSLIWLATWPVLIYISYRLAVFNVNRFEKKQNRQDKELS